MKICVIGNSHVACLKQAYDEGGYDFEIDFFASAANTCEHVKNVEGNLAASSEFTKKSFALSSGGLDSIRLEAYDAIVVHGLFPYEMNLNNKYAAERSPTFYSKAVIDELDLARKSVAMKIASEIRKTSKRLVVCSARPYLARQADSKPGNYERRALLRDYMLTHPCIGLSSQKNIAVFFQPEETVVDATYTDPKYNQGAKRGDDRYPEFKNGDLVHMNSDYGHAYLRELSNLLPGNIRQSQAMSQNTGCHIR